MTRVELEQAQEIELEHEMLYARTRLKVYVVVTALIWVVAIPINVIVARQNPWAIFVMAGTGSAVFVYWHRYRKAVTEFRRHRKPLLPN